MSQDVVVVLTAFNLEYEAVRRHLVDPQVVRHDRGTRFEVGTIRDTTSRVALSLTGKGNHPAAVLAERAIEKFSPVAVLFVGVAGALWDTTALGDVVVANQVYAYHGGTSEDDGLKARPRAWETPHAIAQIAAHLARTGDWKRLLSSSSATPRVHFGPIAAGEVVQNSRLSYEATWIRQHYNDALAIEMEGAGVAQAGHLSGSPVAIVRGISDRADGSKSSSEDRAWQPRAAEHAAAFAIRLADELIKEQEHIVMREPASPARCGVVNNHANGQVGIQAAQVTGSTVWLGAVPPSPSLGGLATELAQIREALARKRSSGALDEMTYTAAKAELDLASEALRTDLPKDTSRFVLALKRLRGLIADVADLAAKIAGLIAAANGVS